MKLPSYPSPRTPISADWGRNVVNYLKALTGRSSATVRVSVTHGGTTYEVRRTGGGSGVELKPFELVNASTDTEAKVRVIYSSLAGEPPAGMNPGDDPPLTLSVTGAGGIYGQVTIDVPGDGAAMFRDIIFSEDTPDDDPAAGVYHVLIGSVSVADGKIQSVANARYGPIDMQVCRNIYAEEDDPKFHITWQSA